MLKEFMGRIYNVIVSNKGRAIGLMLGFVIALSILVIGFLKTFFIVICTLLGYYIGRKFDKNENIFELLERILPNGWR